MAQQILSTNTFTTAKWIVSPTASDGTHTTIQAAITAASSGDTVFIRANSSAYTENLTLKAGVNLSAYPCDGSLNSTGNVQITGKATFTGSGTVSISGIQLNTNSDFLLAVTGSNASIVNLNNCYLNCSNNTGISFTTSNAGGSVNLYYCNGNLGTTGIAYFASTSTGTITIDYGVYQNGGSSLTASTISAGNVSVSNAFFENAITGSSTSGISLVNTDMRLGGGFNITCVTFGGSGSNFARFCNFESGSASALSVGSATTVIDCVVNSTNTNAITGASTITFGGIIFSGSSKKINTTTQSPLVFLGANGGALVLMQSQSPSGVGSIAFTTNFIYNDILIILNDVLPASSTATLEMQVSSNAGVSYSNSGYLCGITYNPYNSTTLTNKNSTTFVPLSGPCSTSRGVNGAVWLHDINLGGFGQLQGNLSWDDTTAGTRVFGYCGGDVGTTGVNALQFLFSSGNISSGVISLYGLQKT